MIGSYTSSLNQSLHSYGFDHALLHLDPFFVIAHKGGAYKNELSLFRLSGIVCFSDV